MLIENLVSVPFTPFIEIQVKSYRISISTCSLT